MNPDPSPLPPTARPGSPSQRCPAWNLGPGLLLRPRAKGRWPAWHLPLPGERNCGRAPVSSRRAQPAVGQKLGMVLFWLTFVVTPPPLSPVRMSVGITSTRPGRAVLGLALGNEVCVMYRMVPPAGAGGGVCASLAGLLSNASGSRTSSVLLVQGSSATFTELPKCTC